jgi:hypothetical protein
VIEPADCDDTPPSTIITLRVTNVAPLDGRTARDPATYNDTPTAGATSGRRWRIQVVVATVAGAVVRWWVKISAKFRP